MCRQNLHAEATYICPSYWLAEAYNTSWKYQHSVAPALHTSDLPAVFSNQGSPNQVHRLGQDYRAAFQRIWRDYVTCGNPTRSVGKVKDHTRPSLYSVNGTRAEALQTEHTRHGRHEKTWPQYHSHSHPIMLNLNQTGGDYTERVVWGPLKAALHLNPGLKNDFTLVNAELWEGGRGARCRFWHEHIWKLPG